MTFAASPQDWQHQFGWLRWRAEESFADAGGLVRFGVGWRGSLALVPWPGNGRAPISILLRSAAVFIVLTCGSSAQSLSDDQEIQFNIPAQPLDAALEAYTQAAGLQVLYRSDLTAARRSTDVNGRFTRSRALNKLLVGTNLTAKLTTEGAFTLFPVSIRSETSEAQSPTHYDLYFGNVQSRIISALCMNTVTRPGHYRAALQFSIDGSGFVSDSSLLDTTGDRTRDQDILGALRGLAVDQAPPPGMPQPVTMLIVPRAQGLPDECRRFSR